MATYNKSLIFKFAWREFKVLGIKTEAQFNICLKNAWSMAKTNPIGLEIEQITVLPIKKAKKTVAPLNITGLYNSYYSYILLYITRKIYNSDIAEELTNDVFINADKALKDFDGTKSNVKTWLHNIAKNITIDYNRSKRYKDKLKEDNVSEYTDENGNELFSFVSDNSTSQALESSELMNTINKAFATLKPKYRRIADLYFIEQYSHAEIMEICDVPEGTVKGMINRCKEMLQAQLQGEMV